MHNMAYPLMSGNAVQYGMTLLSCSILRALGYGNRHATARIVPDTTTSPTPGKVSLEIQRPYLKKRFALSDLHISCMTAGADIYTVAAKRKHIMTDAQELCRPRKMHETCAKKIAEVAKINMSVQLAVSRTPT